MPDKNKYGFSILHDKTKPTEKPESDISTHWDIEEDPSYVAEAAAEFYHSDCDGWESSWPVTVQIFDEAGQSKGIFSVELEFDPTFSASAVS